MFIRITDVKVWPGTWAAYEAVAERLTLEGRRWAEGRVATVLIRSLDDADTGIGIAVWTSREALDAYEATPFYREHVVRQLERMLVGEFPVRHGEVRFIHQEGEGWQLRRPRW
jgi:quinol monooxygenase YgiN